MNGARAAAMRRNAPSTPAPMAAPAGSARGPTTTKSLYITSNRLTPKPSAMNWSSACRSCTSTTSASPRRPMSRAWPVPTATTFTAMPLCAAKRGRMKPNRPDCSVEVVEATMMSRCCAAASPAVHARRSSSATKRGATPRMRLVRKCYLILHPTRTTRSSAYARQVRNILPGACHWLHSALLDRLGGAGGGEERDQSLGIGDLSRAGHDGGREHLGELDIGREASGVIHALCRQDLADGQHRNAGATAGD